MKRTTVTTLVANLRRAIARCLDRIFVRATNTDSQSRGTSRIDDSETTGALCPDVTGGWSLGILLLSSLLAATSLPAAEQDNWYLAFETQLVPTSNDSTGLAYHEDNATGIGQIYVCNGPSSTAKISVYDLNGSLVRDITIAQSRYNAWDLALDANGTIYIGENSAVTCLENNGTFKWRQGKNASISNYGSGGSGNGEFNVARGIDIGPDGNVFVADYANHRIQVLDKNGNFIRKFGSQGSAPGQINTPRDLAFLPDGTLMVADSAYLHYFQSDGTFIQRVNTSNARYNISAAKDGTIYSYGKLRDRDGNVIANASLKKYSDEYVRSSFSPSGDLFISEPYYVSGGSGWNNKRFAIYKRAYRTKGLPTRNVIPQPAIRGIAQRAGTNVIDLDFEIVDPDDVNATVGILAAKDGLFTDPTSWILPTAWVDGTGSKIGASIATNQIHRVSWNVKGDWAEQTGTIKFEVFCQDARRNSPVDLHFLDLPLPDGNLTISRSPIKDTDFSNYFKYLLSTASSQVALENDKITDGHGTVLMETNLQASPAGKDFFVDAVGYRWAKQAELSLAREASTPGGVNAWTASRQIKPRNLPNKVNEYGFDTGSHGARAWWVVKSSTLPIPEFTTTPFDINGTQNEYFGRRVALDGKHLFVGFNDGNKRKLHYYEVSESNGSLTPKSIITPDSEANSQANYFGQAFAIDGDLLAVGAREASESGVSGVGAVYLFDLNGTTPTQVARITASDGTSSDKLGYSVDVSGNLIAAGAGYEDVSGKSDVGAAYLFRRESNGTVTELAKLMHEDPQASDYFGRNAIAVGNSVVAVGAKDDDVVVSGSNIGNAGSVTLFKLDAAGNVTRAMTLTAPNPNQSSAHFGSSLAISGDVLAVGEYNRHNSGSNWSGRTYLYKLNADGTAQLTATINSPTPTPEGHFGRSVALAGDRLAVGAYQENSETATKAGVAYVYKVKADGSATLLEALTHPNGKQNDYLGRSVGISGRNVVAGAYQFDLPPDKWNAGGAVLFHSSF
jgi:hypothetical protein